MRNARIGFAVLCVLGGAALQCPSQAMPTSEGETLSGKKIVLAEAMRGHRSVLVASFSKEASSACGDWFHVLAADPDLKGIEVYQAAMLGQAPGFLRGMIKSAMRKGLPPATQDHFAVLVQDEKQWRGYLAVTDDKEPWVVLLDAAGNVRWHGHGLARDQERLLRDAQK